jgi:hypothetical protein
MGKEQHFPEGGNLDQDLDDNPGIGQSKGTFATGEDPDTAEGENTVEGDTENQSGAQGQVSAHEGRTNK